MPHPGARLGQYELIRELGRGGMGTVYLARDTRLGRRVAIKFLQSEHADLTSRFIIEAQATARCSHENIVIIYEVGEHRGAPFMALEYLRGAPLARLLADGRTLPPGRAIELIVPVVRALICAHEQNIVHRDLKPDNIFVTDAGTVKVLDFGIAKLVHEQHGFAGSTLPVAAPARSGAEPVLGERSPASELTRQGALIGTLPYMSPEQWGAGQVDHRTDLWAVGIILFCMLAGKHPLAPRRGWELLITRDLDQPMPSIREACPSIPDELADIVDACLCKRKEARVQSARQLLDALEPLLPGRHGRALHADESPYAGLRSFQEADADRFFGRAREVAAAVSRLRDQPLLGVVGPSGVGKSSFMRAGIVPALKRAGEEWSTVIVRPGRQPIAALAHAIAPMLRGASSTTSGTGNSSSVADELAAETTLRERMYREPGYLGAVLRSRVRRSQRKIVLFVDQFEELYTLVPDAAERLAFTACLAGAADDVTTPLRVVLSIRSDFLDRVPEDERFMSELAPGLFFLMPPNRDSLREALVQPADMAGYGFESASMVDNMLDHLEHTPGALPLLQFAAARLWELRDRERKLLTENAYQRIGGITGALASHADAVMAELAPASQVLARELFLRLVTAERTRAIVSMDELGELSAGPGEAQRLVEHLVHARLLVVQTGVTGGTVEIVHESLIHRWPLLGRWLDESQEDVAFLEQLRTAAKQWWARGCPDGLLWRGETMEEARRWQRRYRGTLPQQQQRYLEAVFALATRSSRIRRIGMVGTIAFLSLLLAAGAVALVLIRDAQKEATAQAQRAEEHVRHLQAEKEARSKADDRAAQASQEAREAGVEVDRTYEQLRLTNEELKAVAARALESKTRARRAKKRAEAEAAKALEAEAEALRLNAELDKALAEERKRRERLEAQGTLIIEDIPTKRTQGGGQ